MKFAAFICSARFWLSVMLAVTMGMGTAAADIHPVDADEIACQSADVSESHSGIDQDDGEQRPDHDHHAHNCGSCHVHMVGMKGSSFSLACSSSLALRPGADQSLARDGPHGLYRPPRA